MTRINILKREEMNAEQGRVWDAVKTAGGPQGGPHWAYIRVPRLEAATQELGAAIRGASLSKREIQVIVMTVARHWGAKYPWAVQARASLQVGLEQAVLDALDARKTPPLTNPREVAAHQVAHELLGDKKLSDRAYDAALKVFSLEELVAVVAMVGNFSMVCCTANAFDVTPPTDAPARLAD